MTIIFTEAARADLEDIIAQTKGNYPNQLSKLEARFAAVLSRIERRPKSAAALAQREGVRVAPLLRYPFRIFYREIPSGVEILHVHHTARNTL